MNAVESAWARIRAWYETNVNDPPYPDFFDWGAPAEEKLIRALEVELGYKLPADIRQTYSIYDGDNKQWVLPGGYLMDLGEVITTWRMFKEAADQGLLSDSDATATRCAGIKPRWWNPGWIPVLHNGGGDYYCVDTDPDEEGHFAQLIKFEHETGPSHVVAPCIEHFLTRFANDLESSKYEFDMAQGAVKPIT
jgi:cell wall assembly regulator SMI1